MVKIIIVAFAVFGQAKLFPETETPAESEFESTVLPEEHPELALARRAMVAEGLCRSGAAEIVPETASAALPPELPPVPDSGLAANLSEACY